jgi:hypothetical protein
MATTSEGPLLETTVRTATTEDVIRLQSYQIWQQEGCPFGEESKHWEEAKLLIEARSEAEYQKYFVR